MTQQIERRFLKGGELRAKKDGAPGISGVGSVYNKEYDNGWFIETVLPGAFSDVLASNPDVRCLFNHEPDNVLGRTKSGTLRLSDGPDGLHFDCDTDPNTRIGSDVRSMIERGDVDGCSISFVVGEDEWQTIYDATGSATSQRRIIKKFAVLDDVGPVTFPAFTETSVEARSALWPAGVPKEVRNRVAALRSDQEPTKKVDDEALTRDCFLLVGDPDKTDTWDLPWKFSTAEKVKSHLRDALARFNQVKGFSDEALKKAWKKLLVLCDHYGIDVADKSQPRSKRDDGDDDDDDGCTCPCASCQNGDCSGCDCGGCDSENCDNESCDCDADLRMRRRAIEVTL